LEFEEYETIKYWLKSMAGRAEGTKNLYLLSLKQFCEWLGKTPDQLIGEREEQIKSEDKKVQRTMEMNVKAYNAHLESEDAKAGTKTTARAAIKSFFEHHYMPLKFIRGDFPWEPPEERRKVEKDEILAMLNYADARDRALLHVLKDSGLSVSDASKLTIGDIFPETKIAPITKGDVENLPNFIPFTMRRKKTKAKIRTFIGPEAVNSLKIYLLLRLRGTAHMYNTGKDKDERKGLLPEELTLGSPLFRTRSREVKRLSTKSIKGLVRRLAQLSGISGISAHSFRKYTQTMLEVARIDPNWRKQILGKKLAGTEEPYSQPTHELQKAYEEAYQYLQVMEKPLSEEERRIQAIADNARALGIPEEDLQAMLKKKPKPEALIRMLKEFNVNKITKTNGGDCGETFEQIPEANLLAYLKQGWRIECKLQSGEVIVKK